MKTPYQKYSLPQLVFFLLAIGMFIIHLHETCLEKYKNYREAKVANFSDLKEMNHTLRTAKFQETAEHLLKIRKGQKIMILKNMILDAAILQEEFENNKKFEEQISSQGKVEDNSNIAREVELFDI